MSDIQNKQTPIMIKSSRVYYDVVIGKENKNLIPENSDNVEAFVISNGYGYRIRILDFQLRHGDGLETNLISIVKSDKTPIIDGEVQFAQIGNRSAADVIRDCVPVNFTIEAKVDIKVLVTTKSGKPIPPGGVSVTLFGIKD